MKQERHRKSESNPHFLSSSSFFLSFFLLLLAFRVRIPRLGRGGEHDGDALLLLGHDALDARVGLRPPPPAVSACAAADERNRLTSIRPGRGCACVGCQCDTWMHPRYLTSYMNDMAAGRSRPGARCSNTEHPPVSIQGETPRKRKKKKKEEKKLQWPRGHTCRARRACRTPGAAPLAPSPRARAISCRAPGAAPARHRPRWPTWKVLRSRFCGRGPCYPDCTGLLPSFW